MPTTGYAVAVRLYNHGPWWWLSRAGKLTADVDPGTAVMARPEADALHKLLRAKFPADRYAVAEIGLTPEPEAHRVEAPPPGPEGRDVRVGRGDPGDAGPGVCRRVGRGPAVRGPGLPPPGA